MRSAPRAAQRARPPPRPAGWLSISANACAAGRRGLQLSVSGMPWKGMRSSQHARRMVVVCGEKGETVKLHHTESCESSFRPLAVCPKLSVSVDALSALPGCCRLSRPRDPSCAPKACSCPGGAPRLKLVTFEPAIGIPLGGGDASTGLWLAAGPFALTGVDAVGGRSGCTGDLHGSFLLMCRPKLGHACSNSAYGRDTMAKRECVARTSSACRSTPLPKTSFIAVGIIYMFMNHKS